jgi:tRNA G18 (ribose-2'-O)-methylase SpoU
MLDTRDGIPVLVVPQAVMNSVAGYDVHRGCLAIGERPAPAGWHELIGGAQLVVVLEGVGNPDNVGAIFRNAAAFGADAVLLGPSCADPLYRKAIRTSMAATLVVPFASVPRWPEALQELDRDRFSVIAMTPALEGMPLQEVARRTRGRAVAIVAGHEGAGLTIGALSACDYLARIPMSPQVDSLNVATALAIGLYAISAERNRAGSHYDL